jgi:cytochrome c peroxidase
VSELEHLDQAKRSRLIETTSDVAALGRYAITLRPEDMGKFRTPSLRDVAITYPYMHDGSVRTLARAVDLELYYRGTQLGDPIILSPADRAALLDFLHSLTSGPSGDRGSRDDNAERYTGGQGSRRGG